MRLLLDTHALIWWQAGGEKLPRSVRETIADDSTQVFVSAVSAFEIAQKARLGRLEIWRGLLEDFPGDMAEQGFVELPVTTAHALRAGQLDIDHRDPFDRLLIAQALTEQMTLVSIEELFDRAAVSRLWG